MEANIPGLVKMEEILKKLLVPDNSTIQEGTAELREAYKDPNSIPELCRLMTSSEATEVRQYSALLLRKKFGKPKVWFKLDVPVRSTIKDGCLQALINEPEKSVKQSIAQLIAVLAKPELPNGGWPELLQFLSEYLSNANQQCRLLGMYTLSVLSETIGGHLKLYYKDFVKVFSAALQSDDMELGYYTIIAMTHLVIHVGSDELNSFQPLVGLVIKFIPRLIDYDETKANEAMEVFDELFESEVAIVVPHIKPISELCLSIAKEDQLEDAIRIKAITFLGRLTRNKKKTIVKHKLYIPMINVLFPLMCQITDDDLEEDESNGNSPLVCASQTLDILAIHLPPDKFMSALLSHVEPALKGNDPAKLKGALNALAVSAEGCSENIRKKYLVHFLACIGSGIKHEHPSVRNAALYALGQYSEFLQPEISEYANDILPVLYDYLDSYSRLVQVGQNALPGIERVFYALEMFCDNLGTKLVPYLPDLMNRLLAMLGEKFSNRIKELTISGIGAAASSVEGEIIPYFDQIIGPLKQYLTFDYDDDSQILLTQSMDTLGVLAKAVGPASFAPALAEECCKLGIDLVTKYDDPDVRKCAFSLFAAVGFVVKEEIATILPQLTEMLLLSLRSKEGININYSDEDAGGLPLDELSDEEGDEVSLDKEEENDLNGVKTINVENAFMEEKEQAILALKDLCVHAGNSFYPYLYLSLEDTWKLIEFPDEDIRSAAVKACTEFAIAFLKHGTNDSAVAFEKAVNMIVPKFCELVANDEEVTVVSACLESIAHLLKDCKQAVARIEGHPEGITQAVHKVMRSECRCMDAEEGEDDEEAELDELLFEYAGEVLPNLGRAMDPAKFSLYFAGSLPHMLKKTKGQCTVAEKSFAAGSLAECMEPLQGVLEPFVQHLLNPFLNLMDDEDCDVRNNAIFGIGELALYGGECVYPAYPKILQKLSSTLGAEKSPRVIDQVVGAVCRLIIAKAELVPLDEVVPVIFSNLPLKEDDEEYVIIYRCLNLLFTLGNPHIKPNLPKLIQMSADVVGTKSCDENVKPQMMQFLSSCKTHFVEDFQNAMSAVNPEVTTKLTSILA